MSRTRHFKARMSQRAIKKELVNLTLKFGDQNGDKVILNKSGGKKLLEELRNLEKITKALIDKGGVVVIESNGDLITTYRVDSFNPKAS